MSINLLDKNQTSFVANSFYLYVSHFSDYLLSLFILPLIARSIGAVEFGKIGIIQTFGILILLIMEFGSSLTATREISRIKNSAEKLKDFIGKLLTFKLITLSIVALISSLSALFIPVFRNNLFFLFLVILGSVFQGITPTWYFQGIEKMKSISISKTFFRFLGFIIIVVFVKTSKDSWIVLASFTFSSILICIYLYYKLLKQIGYFKLKSPVKSFSIYHQSIHSFLSSVIPVLNQNINLVLLSLYVSPIHIGYYYGANRIYRAFNTLYGPLSQAFYPIIAASDKNKGPDLNLIRNYTILIFLIGFLFYLINYVFAEKIILTFFGSDYFKSIEVLKLFSIVLPLTAISNSLGRQWLMASNKDAFYSLVQIISSVVSFLFFILFIRSHGIMAVPISLIFYELSSILIISVYLIKYDRK